MRLPCHAWIGPGAIISQTLTIGQNAVVSLGAVVISDVEPDARVSGNFAGAHRALLRNVAGMKALG
jgi:acetyltransferase-like isoleucine patch superfamily enzyme